MSELGKRIITAIVLLAFVWLWYFEMPVPWFEVVLALIGFGASCELTLMAGLRKPGLYMFTSSLLWVAFFINPVAVWLVLVGLIFFALFVATSRQGEAAFANFFAFIWLYLWLYLFAMAVADTHSSEQGQALVIGACLAIWVADSAAYFVGRAVGKRKLCPSISPGKSVEGLLGGVLFAIPVAVVCWMSWGVTGLWFGTLLALVTVVAGVLGDLSESAVKRMVGVKDSGKWLPGHGGILDRIDALLMGVPAAWLVGGVML